MKKSKSSPWGAIIGEFKTQMLAEGKSDNTVSTYLLAVKQFVACHKDIDKVNDISQQSVNKFFLSFNPRRGTLNLKKNAIRKWISFLKTEYSFKKDIRIPIKDLPRPEPQYLTVEEQTKLLQYLKGKGDTFPHYVMLKLMLFTGLRISELTNLRFSDVENTGLVLRQTKHGSVKRKRLKNEINTMLKQFINARRNKSPLNEAPSGSEDYLFMSRYDGKYKPYSRQAVNQIVKKYVREIGITKKVSCHTLRHSFSVRFLKHGGTLLGLKIYLGHKSLTTTEIYSHISNTELEEQLERL